MQLGFFCHILIWLDSPFYLQFLAELPPQGSVTAGLSSKLFEVSDVAAVNTTISFGMKLQFHHSFLAVFVLKAKESSVQPWKMPDKVLVVLFSWRIFPETTHVI